MKLLPNINKSVPEAADPALIKPVSDALEALDTALGAAPSTLTTTAKTLVGAINEIDGDADVLKYRGAPGASTDANTLTTGIYLVALGADFASYNYPARYGVLVSFKTPTYGFQICTNASYGDFFYFRGTHGEGVSWKEWKQVTLP